MSSAHGGDDPVEELETIEELEMIEEIEGEQSSSTLTALLGELHPAVIHFPIAWMALLGLLEIINLFRQRPTWHRAGGYLLFLTVLSLIPAVTTGWLQSGRLIFAEPYLSILEWHRNLNFLSTALLLAALLIRPKQLIDRCSRSGIIYLVLVGVTTALVLFSGHLGGRLVHG